MKRFLCTLMALMLLCGGAQAEAWKGSITWESDAQGALAYLTETSDDDPKRMKALAEAMAELAQNLDVQFGWQDDGVYASVSLKDTTLLDVACWSDEVKAALLTSLLPGHYVEIAPTAEEAAASQAAVQQLESTDWLAVGAEAATAFASWGLGLKVTEEYGNFMGDAYDGGVFRESYTFDDKAIAELDSALVNVLDKYGINDALLDDYLGESGLISSFTRWNNQIASENRYSYVLSVVYGVNEKPIGYSLVCLDAGVQIMTLSLAAADNGLRIVWGYGLNGQNYYICSEIIDGETADETLVALMVYQDPQHEGYLAAEARVENVLLMADGSICSRNNGWTAEIEVLDPMADVMDTYYVLDSEWREAGSKLTMAWYLPDGDARAEVPMQKISIVTEPCEPQTWTTDDLTAITMDASTENVELIDSLVQDAAQDLLIRLFKLVPTQLLTMLMGM